MIAPSRIWLHQTFRSLLPRRRDSAARWDGPDAFAILRGIWMRLRRALPRHAGGRPHPELAEVSGSDIVQATIIAGLMAHFTACLRKAAVRRMTCASSRAIARRTMSRWRSRLPLCDGPERSSRRVFSPLPENYEPTMTAYGFIWDIVCYGSPTVAPYPPSTDYTCHDLRSTPG